MKAFFVNSGILGHASVAELLSRTLAGRAGLSAVHLNLSEHLTPVERIRRRLMCWGGQAPSNRFDALTMARWRREAHTGRLAARRLVAAERAHGRPDLLHFHTQATALGSLARMQRTPSIVSIDITQPLASLEVPTGFRRWQYNVCARAERRVFRAARAIMSTSRWAADDLCRTLPECAGRVHVMPYPVPLDGFAASWAADRAARTGPVRVLFVGGDFPRKGGWDLLDAWRALGGAPGAALHLVTNWPLAPDRLPAGVVVHRGVRAYTADWFAHWRDADVFVLPTTGEAFGMVFQEAAAAALPAIGTRLNAVPELIVDGETGLLVPPRDPGALSAALRQLVSDAALRRRMGEAARHRAASDFAPAAYADRLFALMQAITSSPAPPA